MGDEALLRSRMRHALLVVLAAACTCATAQDIAIGKVDYYTENRGWNEAGLGPTYQIVVGVTVVPSGLPTLVFAEQGSLRQPFSHFAQPSTPDLYSYWQRYDLAYAGAWRITAERGEGRKAEVRTRALAKPQQVPLARNVRITGAGTSPQVHWELPDLSGFDVERIRVGVRGEPRVQGRFLSMLYVSGDLPPSATAFTIPPGVLAAGGRYVFQVMLEDLEDGALENRSAAFSAPYVAAR